MGRDGCLARRFRDASRVVLAVFMVAVGVAHFARPEPFVQIVPPQLPRPRDLVYVSGFFEILGGLGLLLPPFRRAAAWGLMALFIAVFPANIHMAVNDIAPQGLPHNRLLSWLRLPLQGVLIGWAWWHTGEGNRSRTVGDRSATRQAGPEVSTALIDNRTSDHA